MTKTNLVFVITAIVAMIVGVYLGQSSHEETKAVKPPVIQGAIYPEAKVLKPFSVIDQNGQTITKDDFMNHWSLVFVGYTHCPDICPTTMDIMNQVVGYMQDQQMQPPQIIFLSIDPERDTPERLKEYVVYFNEHFTGLTGTADQIRLLTQQLNAVYKKAPGAAGSISDDDYLMDHSSALMLINPQGNMQSILTAPHLPGIIIESILQSQAYYDVVTGANPLEPRW